MMKYFWALLLVLLPALAFAYTKKIEGTTNVEDTYIYSDALENNHGANVILTVRSAEYNSLVRVQNVASELGAGATISACVCSLYCYYKLGGGSNVSAFIVFKPWNEGALTNSNPDDAAEGEGVATWVDWSNDDEEWATAGCNNADDEGVDNSGDGTGADRTATAEDVQDVGSAGVWHGWDISPDIAQAWYDGTKNEEGIVLMGDDNIVRFYSTESAEDEKPFWTFTYTSAAPQTKKIEGTTNVEDAYVDQNTPDHSYGGGTLLKTYTWGSWGQAIFIRVKNLDTELPAGATITSCVCSLYCSENTTDGVIDAYSVFKPWVEGDDDAVDNDDGDVTHNDWASDANEFGTEGCECARDAGVDNSNDDGECTDANADRKATAESSTEVTSTGWWSWSVSAATAQAWYDGTRNENGIFLLNRDGDDNNNDFTSTEGASNQPFWVITYTTGEPEAAGQFIMIH